MTVDLGQERPLLAGEASSGTAEGGGFQGIFSVELMSLAEETKYIVIKLIPMDRTLFSSKFTVSCHHKRLGAANRK